ncbi:FAD/NAD(P)-binding protein [Nakamurella lactea]|uniref:FAD/NAD(P)-binding protein n=1 Tax=Nakamurella lactea TaxID=459515 RepID=UPI0004075257|nr:FAD/NAD(P)-binding protein [Nakamurella lactea]
MGTPVLVFVGGGPRTTGLLDRLAASAPELLPSAAAPSIHVVDPFPAGGGRIWRREQSDLLWMNSVAEDITVFTDTSVTCDGPVVPGPSLADWIAGEGSAVLAAAGLGHQVQLVGRKDFAPREVQACYLGWAFDRAVSALPAGTELTTHRERAVSVTDRADGRQCVRLAGGRQIVADVVVLAQGYLDRTPTPADAELAERAAARGLTYLPPGYTADIDLSALRPGQAVLVRGFGLAFIDLMVLLGEGRGGRFTAGDDGTLTYHPSGREPVLYVGSRRGVPYHAKLGYPSAAAGPVPTRYFTAGRLDELGAGELDFRSVIWPLIAKELTAAHYRRLFEAHTDRTTVDWAEFSCVLDAADVFDPAFAGYAESAVPKDADRFDIRRIDRPLRDLVFGSRDDLAGGLRDYVRADLARRRDQRYSADRAVFDTLLSVYGVLAVALTTGRISAADRIRFVEGEFHGLFSFLASGPPPRRLAELLALHDAGLLHFAGPELQIQVRDGVFVGTSAAVPGEIRASALVDARLPRPDVRAATDPLIRGLLADGELAAEDLTDAAGRPLGGGQLLADRCSRALRADRSRHPSRFLLGPSVSGSAGAAGFSRPGFNGPGFRQNDAVAREVLRLLAAATARRAGSSVIETSTIEEGVRHAS